MPTSSSQSWPRGFSPLFRNLSSDQHLRVSDAERQAVADRLGEHYADGRLDQAELDERVGRAMSAKTRADLGGLFDDLPDGFGPQDFGPAGATGPTGATGPAPMPMRPMRSWYGRRHPVLLIVLAVFAVTAVAHAPWLWLGFVFAVLFLATRGARHPRPSHDH